MDIKHVFTTRRVEHLEAVGEELWELISPEGERIAAASTEEPLFQLEMALNMVLTDACENNGDITTAVD